MNIKSHGCSLLQDMMKGLKIRFPATEVRIQFPPRAPILANARLAVPWELQGCQSSVQSPPTRSKRLLRPQRVQRIALRASSRGAEHRQQRREPQQQRGGRVDQG